MKKIIIFFFLITQIFAYSTEKKLPSKSANKKTSNSFEQGYPLKEEQSIPTYAYPGAIQTGNVDIFVSGSFLYYQILTEEYNYLYRAYPGNLADSYDAIGWNYKYKPGFKVNLGCIFSKLDHWQFTLEYLRYHATNHLKEKIRSSDDYFIPSGTVFPNVFTSIYGESSLGKLDFDYDMGNLTFGRSCYLGSRFIWYPYMGVKGWAIEAKLDADVIGVDGSSNPMKVMTWQKTKFWSVGFIAGFEGKYLLGAGFRVFGKASGDLLYTESTFHAHWKSFVSGNLDLENYSNDFRKALTPEIELALGLGWGSYFASGKAHFDLLAEYDFLSMWEHAAVRNIFENFYIDNPSGIFYLHGLNITTKIDF